MFYRIAALLIAGAMPASQAFAETAFVIREGIVAPTVLSDGLEAAPAWKNRVQTIFSPKTQDIERRAYEVADPAPQLDLDFTWAADDLAADRAGRVFGSGRLTWRRKDVPVYDHSGVVAAYIGALRNGRFEGEGIYATRDGLLYEGQWKAGRAHGRGRLVLPNGEHYEGSFRNGFAEGSGIFTETTWERFEGTFRAGRRDGTGKTILPSGLAYESYWKGGTETPNSMRIRVAQAGAAPPIGGTDDIRLGITMERNPRLPAEVKAKDVLLYAARSGAEGLTVEPADRRMVDAWVGKRELENQPYSGMDPRDGLFSIEKTFVQPAAFKLDFQNKSQQPVEVQSIDVVVRESMTENKPAIDVNIGAQCTWSYSPTLWITNHGWSDALDGKLNVGFVAGGSKAQPDKLGYTVPVGSIKFTKEVNYEKIIAEAGANVRQLKAYSGDGKNLPCSGTDKQACVKALQSNPIFGKLGPLLRLSGDTVYVTMRGTYQYNWIDAKGVQQTHSSPISMPVGLGNLPVQAECGAGGPPDAVRMRATKLRLDAQNYTLAVPFRRAIPPGRTANFTLPLEADKSSRHQFEIVAKLSDGRQIRSPTIKLLYYRPRPEKTN
jgi:hypothetical protein